MAGGNTRWRQLRRRFSHWLDAVGVLRPLYGVWRRWLAARAGEPDAELAGMPFPPARLRVLVDSNGDPDVFERAGRISASTIVRVLTSAGVEFGASCAPVLDFGCGCGRVARQWARRPGVEKLDLHGCDYNGRLVEWCAENLDFMNARVNRAEPPLAYSDGQFGLVYAISVFTHLTEELAAAWLEELTRVIRPGGHLLLSVHGSVHRYALPPTERARFDAGEAVVLRHRMKGTNACAAYHPRPYMERLLARHSDHVTFSGDGANLPFRQDVYVARVRPQPSATARCPR